MKHGNPRNTSFTKSKLFYTLRTTYSIDVLGSGRVGSVGPVALKGEVVFGSKRDKGTGSCHKLGKNNIIHMLEFHWIKETPVA